LSGLLARGSIWCLSGFSLAGGPDGQEVLRQHAEPHLDPHPLQAASTEPTQLPVLLGGREPQLDRPAPPAVHRLGLGRLPLPPVRLDQFLMFIPLDRAPLGPAGALPRPRARLAVLLGAAVSRQLDRPPIRSLPRLPADSLQPMPARAHIDLLLGPPGE